MQHHASPETPAIVGYDGQLILSACLLSHRPITTSHICGSLSYTDTCHNTHCTLYAAAGQALPPPPPPPQPLPVWSESKMSLK